VAGAGFAVNRSAVMTGLRQRAQRRIRSGSPVAPGTATLREEDLVEQRFSFDQAAPLYDAVRPDYPAALFDDVMSEAGLAAGDAILEIGCGTGKATLGLAPRGFPMLATDPGQSLLQIARRHLAPFPNVRFERSTFEAWPMQRGAFALVVAAQAWHWIEPETAFARAAEALAPDGMLAVFGNVPVGLSSDLFEAFNQIYRQHDLPYGRVPENYYLPGQRLAIEFRRSVRFGKVTHKAYSWSVAFDAAGFADWLRTRSDHQSIPVAAREALLGDITAAIAAHGNHCELSYQTHLHLARRVTPSPQP
jgi:SAM-dependent methyltransferase